MNYQKFCKRYGILLEEIKSEIGTQNLVSDEQTNLQSIASATVINRNFLPYTRDTFDRIPPPPPDKILLGIFENQEYKDLSFIHELCHIIYSYKGITNKYELESAVWNNTFKFAKKNKIKFSDDAIDFSKKCLATYEKYKEELLFELTFTVTKNLKDIKNEP